MSGEDVTEEIVLFQFDALKLPNDDPARHRDGREQRYEVNHRAERDGHIKVHGSILLEIVRGRSLLVCASYWGVCAAGKEEPDGTEGLVTPPALERL